MHSSSNFRISLRFFLSALIFCSIWRAFLIALLSAEFYWLLWNWSTFSLCLFFSGGISASCDAMQFVQNATKATFYARRLHSATIVRNSSGIFGWFTGKKETPDEKTPEVKEAPSVYNWLSYLHRAKSNDDESIEKHIRGVVESYTDAEEWKKVQFSDNLDLKFKVLYCYLITSACRSFRNALES